VPAVSYSPQLPTASIGDLQGGTMVNPDHYYPFIVDGSRYDIEVEI